MNLTDEEMVLAHGLAESFGVLFRVAQIDPFEKFVAFALAAMFVSSCGKTLDPIAIIEHINKKGTGDANRIPRQAWPDKVPHSKARQRA